MAKTIGRNEPCPCGSGKKYKRCCGSGTAYASPEEIFESMHDHFGQSGLHDDNPMDTFQEIHGTPNAATEELHKFMEYLSSMKHSPGSIDEFNTLAESYMNAKNQASVPSFLGLSPVHLHEMISQEFGAENSVYELNPDITPEDIPDIPLLHHSLLILNYIRVHGKVKATALGNLSRAVVRDLYPQVIDRLKVLLNKKPEEVMSEIDVASLYLARTLLQDMHLITQRGSFFALTEEGYSMLDASLLSDLYRELLVFYLNYFDESHTLRYDFYQDLRMLVRDIFPFCLYMLKQTAAESLELNKLARQCIDAFPDFFIPTTSDKEQQHLEYALSREIISIPKKFGLVKELPEGDIMATHCRITPLYDRVITWKV